MLAIHIAIQLPSSERADRHSSRSSQKHAEEKQSAARQYNGWPGWQIGHNCADAGTQKPAQTTDTCRNQCHGLQVLRPESRSRCRNNQHRNHEDEADGLQLSSLTALAVVLFVIAFLINAGARLLVSRGGTKKKDGILRRALGRRSRTADRLGP